MTFEMFDDSFFGGSSSIFLPYSPNNQCAKTESGWVVLV
jgi:hypothetical protein